MNRNQAKNLLYMGSDFADECVNRVSVDFMYQARVREVERRYLLSDPSGMASLDDDALQLLLARLAEARYALLRNQQDLYQVGNQGGVNSNDDPFDDFESKRNNFITTTNEPVYTPAEMRFVARPGLRNALACSWRFLLCPLAAIIAFVLCVGYDHRAAIVIGSVLLVVVFSFYLLIFIPYTMKQIYVRDIVFGLLERPHMARLAGDEDDGTSFGLYVGNISDEWKTYLKKKKLKDMFLWHKNVLCLPSVWAGIALGAACALLSLLFTTPISSESFFTLGLPFAVCVAAAAFARTKKSDDLLGKRMDSLRRRLRRVRAR